MTPGLELPQLTGIVPASVYGLSVLEGVRDTPALLVGQSGRSVLRCAVSGGSWAASSKRVISGIIGLKDERASWADDFITHAEWAGGN